MGMISAWLGAQALPVKVGIAAAAVVAVAGCAFWLRHSGYEAGYSACEAEYQAAVAKVGEAFMGELAARDKQLEDASGKVIEVVKWRTRTETVYREALKNDPDCQAWASGRIACPLGLPAEAADRAGVPADPADVDR